MTFNKEVWVWRSSWSHIRREGKEYENNSFSPNGNRELEWYHVGKLYDGVKTGTVISCLSTAHGGPVEDAWLAGLEKRILMETCGLQGREGTFKEAKDHLSR